MKVLLLHATMRLKLMHDFSSYNLRKLITHLAIMRADAGARSGII